MQKDKVGTFLRETAMMALYMVIGQEGYWDLDEDTAKYIIENSIGDTAKIADKYPDSKQAGALFLNLRNAFMNIFDAARNPKIANLVPAYSQLQASLEQISKNLDAANQVL